MAGETLYFSTLNSMWPDLANQRAKVNSPRNGVDRVTGKMLSGWNHCQQSMEVIFETPFHERVLRRWVGSFVPMILGRSAVERVITRFFWAIASALDLWEPGYKIRKVHFMGDALQSWSPMTEASAADLLRAGQAIFRQEGAWYPRGHLGDFTPYQAREFTYAPIATQISLSGRTIPERSPNGTVVGTASLAGLYYVGEPSWGLIDPTGTFEIDSETGEVTVLDNTALNYDVNQTLPITITVEGINPGANDRMFNIAISDVEGPYVLLVEDGSNLMLANKTDKLELVEYG